MSHRTIIDLILRDNAAASAIEYGLILAGLSIGIIFAAQGVAIGLGSVWSIVSNNTNTAFNSSSG
jgi:Flp pilus assembly pilin Flp